MTDSEILTAHKALMSTLKPFDCDPRGDTYRVMIHADGRSYLGEGGNFASAASNAVRCYRTKGET
ncbi:hypothetical protein UFOVP1229_71 [uncultured Caudovirales phage]|uniref:Uncharacterized protein n=1 Tax=uncultured Caudovirales phage TaxID=2100421 RepID=A0A6J5R2Y9_9CAUD|nr:hypothetical protein UFOVP1229_71 [uncultured Caudovirales phage]